MADHFNPKGFCEGCGKPIGTLKDTHDRPMDGIMGGYPPSDPVIYHIAASMQLTTIRCEDGDK